MINDKSGRNKAQPIDERKLLDSILEKIRGFITVKGLKVGDRLPAEREFCSLLNVSRGHLRKALEKLELFGFVKILPQHGTIVTDQDGEAIKGLLSNIFEIEGVDFKSLLEVRSALEVLCARLAAVRATDEDIKAIEEAYEAHRQQTIHGSPGLDENDAFHSRIAECSRNPILKALMNIILPDVLTLSKAHFDIFTPDRLPKVSEEHREILSGIRKRDPRAAAKAMIVHMRNARLISAGLYHLSQKLKKKMQI